MLDGDAPAAASLWRTHLQATPDDTYAELQWARALGGGGDFKAATERLQRLTARDPNDPRAWFELGKFSILLLGSVASKVIQLAEIPVMLITSKNHANTALAQAMIKQIKRSHALH